MKCNSETLIFSLFFSQNLLGNQTKQRKKKLFHSRKKKKPIFPIHHTTNQTKHIKHSFHFPYFLVNFLRNQTTCPLTLYPTLKQKQTQKKHMHERPLMEKQTISDSRAPNQLPESWRQPPESEAIPVIPYWAENSREKILRWIIAAIIHSEKELLLPCVPLFLTVEKKTKAQLFCCCCRCFYTSYTYIQKHFVI